MEQGITNINASLIDQAIRDSAVLEDDSSLISQPCNSGAAIVAAASKHFASTQTYLDLIFSTAINSFNDHLDDEINSPRLDTVRDKRWDNTAEAVASQIMGSITSEFAPFYDCHPELSEDAVLTRFINLTTASLSLAHNELKETLEDYNKLDSEYAALLEDTFELLTEALEEFIESFGYSDAIAPEDLYDDDDSFHLDQWPDEVSPHY